MLDSANRLLPLGTVTMSSSSFRHRIGGAILIALLTAASPAIIRAAECPPPDEQVKPRIPAPGEKFASEKSTNIGVLTSQLIEYKEGKDGRPGDYDEDVKKVFDRALTYVQQRVAEAKKSGAEDKPLAIVLDIDETSLSNWPNLKANNFGFIKGGPCFEEPTLACGFDEWILKASAPAIPQALTFYNTVINTTSVAIFFITGRPDSHRRATLLNLDAAGFQGFAGLRTRPDDQLHDKSIVPFKSAQRKLLEQLDPRGKPESMIKPYKVIATIGDQESDLAGGFAECSFKVPNPFYFIP